MSITIFQFNGCDKCFNETLLLNSDVERIKIPADPSSLTLNHMDIAIITGYVHPSDEAIIKKIGENATKTVAFGTCATRGGIFGLAYQHGIKILPTKNILPNSLNIDGCLGEVEELQSVVDGEQFTNSKLCDVCSRKSTCKYITEVIRQLDPDEDDGETCYNDVGLLCSGYIAKGCKEQCVNSGAPCRGCKPSVDRPGFRMLGMYGTLCAHIEVATEATGKGGTDKLADDDDDLTDAAFDVAGSFFRFALADSVMPIGRIASTGNLISDVFIGRPLEEIPVMLGHMGGSKAISLVLNSLEAYEKSSDIEVDEDAKQSRSQLLELERKLNDAISNSNKELYKETTDKIREIAGNMNLSALYFGGTRSNPHVFDYWDTEFLPGPYESGPVKYSLDGKGVITEFSIAGMEAKI